MPTDISNEVVIVMSVNEAPAPRSSYIIFPPPLPTFLFAFTTTTQTTLPTHSPTST